MFLVVLTGGCGGGDSHPVGDDDGGTDSGTYGAFGSEAGLDGDVDSGSDEEDADADVDADTPEEDAGVDSGSGEGDADVDANMSCEPKGCSELGYECGTPDDGCGDALDCGKCDSPETCGGGGTDYVCGCTPMTCDDLSSERGTLVCGAHADGCGGTVDCGTSQCTGFETCGGGDVVDECGCAPNVAACAGKDCGTAEDGCGNTVQCGANAGACGSAARECGASQTCDCKSDAAAICGSGCGTKTVDGCSFDCGSCTADCASGASCTDCNCVGGEVCSGNPGMCCLQDAPATTCGAAECGTKVNNCGVVVPCGSCTGGKICSGEAKCEDPAVAALIGKYAVRSVGFGLAAGVVTRAEGLLLVDIFRDSQGTLQMREQSCASAGYAKDVFVSTIEDTLTSAGPALSQNLPSTTIPLDLTKTDDVPGPKDWLRPIQPVEQNATGWRHGWPSYCPAGSGAPSAALTGYYGPDGQGKPDPRALGALKPWLGGAACLCPAEEVAKRGLCSGKAGSELAACVADWAQNTLPYSPGVKSDSSDVTDCRVVDDDEDGFPGATSDVTYLTASATLRSASVFANKFWGAIDLSGDKMHWGVSQDHAGLAAAAVACEDATGFGSGVLCSTGGGKFCVGYDPAVSPPTKVSRVNPIDFIPLDALTPPQGGWTCQAIYDQRSSLLRSVDGPSGPNWPSRYPSSGICQEDK